MGCPHNTGDEVCASCAAARQPLKPQLLPGEDATAQTLRRDSSDSIDRVPAAGAETIGRYVIQDVLGRGGMGLVYTAFDPVLNRKVAIKVLRARPGKGSQSSAESTRLLREAQAMAQLSHPNVVPVYDFGVAGDDVYVAMALIAGTTLYDWVKQTRPGWREVLPVFFAAGRGLQAAHEAGLVHRDFKPTNVLLDEKLQPHVTDFGLARSLRSTSSDDTVSDSGFDLSQPVSLDTPLTRAGQVMGSPGYMAPEQYDGASTSPATDQYAFCVSLYESLYGKRPFRGPDLTTLGNLARKAEVPPPPKGSTVPAWIFPIIVRGLAADPAQRHPSIAALLEALSRDPARLRRRWLAAGGAALLLGGVVAGLNWRAVQEERACLSAAQKVNEVWSAAAREAGQKAFLATGRSWASTAWENARKAVDRYTEGWTRARVEACEATRVHGVQSEHHLALRLDCLDRRLDELATLASVFSTADAVMVGQATDAVARLSPVSACSNLSALEARARAAPRGRESWERVLRETAQGRVLVAAGRLAIAREKLEPAAREAAALGEPTLQSEAFEAKGELERASGKFVEARADFERAVRSALAAGDDLAAARQLAALVSLVGWRLERPDEGMTLAGIARGLLERVGSDRAIESRIFEGIGDTQWQAGDRESSSQSYQKALDLLRGDSGPGEAALHDSLDIARLKSSIGWVLSEQGKLKEARVQLRDSYRIREALLGPDHPLLSETWNELATLAVAEGEFDEAVAAFTRAVEIRQSNLGPDALPVARMRMNLAEALVAAGKVSQAQEQLAIAAKILQTQPGAPVSWPAQLQRVEALALAEQEKWPEALAQSQGAVALTRSKFGAAHFTTGEALKEHGGLLVRAGRPKEALPVLEEFLGIALKHHAFATPNDVPMGRVALGRALLALGRGREARRHFEDALGELAPRTGHRRLKAEAQLGLAQALGPEPGDRPRARELASAAAQLFEAAGRPQEAGQARAWLEAQTAVR